LDQRVHDLDEREQKLNQNSKEFEDKCQQWQQKIDSKEKENKNKAPSLTRQQSLQLLSSVKEANAEVEKDRLYLSEKLAKAEEAKEKLQASEKLLKERVEILQSFLSFVEHEGLLPEAVHFKKLLKSIKYLSSSSPSQKRIKCFISYAWQPNQTDNANLQAKLVKIKNDLTKSGIEVMLDITNLEGDINRYMADGIEESDRVLLVSIFS
jgi:Skp family chaperone for outer membrane proteins